MHCYFFFIPIQCILNGYCAPQYGWYGTGTGGGALPPYSFPQGYNQYQYQTGYGQGGLGQLAYSQYGRNGGYNGYNNNYGVLLPSQVVVDFQNV